MSNGKITFLELEAKLADIDVPEAELQQYFIANTKYARPFQPSLRINADLVEVTETEEPRVEAGIVGGFINNIARFRRRKRFKRNRKKHPNRKVLVSEGDSWFQFPFFIEDVIDQLSNDFNVLSVGAAGDTLQNMILENPEYLDALDDVGGDAKGFVFSGGGNDVIGEDEEGKPVLQRLVRDFDPNLTPAEHLVAAEVDTQFGFIRNSYETMIEDIRLDFPELPIFIHGYGYVFPGNFDASDQRDPFYADRDKWVAGPLADKGITDPVFQRDIVKALLDRFHDTQLSLVNDFQHIHKIDVRNTVANLNEWADEIHPNDHGFAKVATEFVQVIEGVV